MLSLHHHNPKPTPTNQNPTPIPSDPITNHPNNQRHQPRHDHRLSPIGPPDRLLDRVESQIRTNDELVSDLVPELDLNEPAGEEESEHDEPRDRISEGGERCSERQHLGEHRGAEAEQGTGAERNREWETER